MVTEISGLAPDSWTSVPVEDITALLSGPMPRFNAKWDRNTNELLSISVNPDEDDEGSS